MRNIAHKKELKIRGKARRGNARSLLAPSLNSIRCHFALRPAPTNKRLASYELYISLREKKEFGELSERRALIALLSEFFSFVLVRKLNILGPSRSRE